MTIIEKAELVERLTNEIVEEMKSDKFKSISDKNKSFLYDQNIRKVFCCTRYEISQLGKPIRYIELLYGKWQLQFKINVYIYLDRRGLNDGQREVG